MNDQRERPVLTGVDPDEAEYLYQKKESLFTSVVLFRILPVLLVFLSMSCLFFGWMRISDNLKEDLNHIQKYVGIGNGLMNKYLGTSQLAGINTEEIDEMLLILSDGQLTPTEILTKGDTVRNAAVSVRKICTTLKLESKTADALESLADSLKLFQCLYYAVAATGLLTVILILFRKKILGNWFFSAATVLMAGWCWQLVRTVKESSIGSSMITCTLVPVLAMLFSLPLIPYGKKKRKNG